MVEKGILKIGDKVYYQPEHYKNDNRYENGIVKEVPEHTEESVRVVYNCNEDWVNYKDYTSALTSLSDLYLGWFKNRGSKEIAEIVEKTIKSINNKLIDKYGTQFSTKLNRGDYFKYKEKVIKNECEKNNINKEHVVRVMGGSTSSSPRG